MIICTVCATENDQYATICKKCGSFLQNRVPNLDLFHTLWKVLENPKSAFQMVMLSEHKNYSMLLYTLCGISIAFTGFWHFRLGYKFENIFFLSIWALMIGIPFGITLCPLVSFFHWILVKIFGGKSSFRSSLGITSYALFPIIISLVFVLPIKLLTFGMYLFTFNPQPMAIKPVSYIMLIGFDVAFIVWTFILSVIGTSIGNQIPFWKSILLVIILFAIVVGGLIVGGEYTLNLL